MSAKTNPGGENDDGVRNDDEVRCPPPPRPRRSVWSWLGWVIAGLLAVALGVLFFSAYDVNVVGPGAVAPVVVVAPRPVVAVPTMTATECATKAVAGLNVGENQDDQQAAAAEALRACEEAGYKLASN